MMRGRELREVSSETETSFVTSQGQKRNRRETQKKRMTRCYSSFTILHCSRLPPEMVSSTNTEFI
jgi:hypothetical protein